MCLCSCACVTKGRQFIRSILATGPPSYIRARCRHRAIVIYFSYLFALFLCARKVYFAFSSFTDAMRWWPAFDDAPLHTPHAFCFISRDDIPFYSLHFHLFLWLCPLLLRRRRWLLLLLLLFYYIPKIPR